MHPARRFSVDGYREFTGQLLIGCSLSKSRLPKLPFGERAGQTFSSAESFYGFIQDRNPAVLKASVFEADFAFKGSILDFPDLRLSTSASDACQITTQAVSPRFSLVIPITGHGELRCKSRPCGWNSADDIIINPLREQQVVIFPGIRSQILLEIDSSRMVRTMINMFGADPLPGRVNCDHATIQSMNDRERHFRSLLVSSLQLIDASEADIQHLARVGLDDVIVRIAAEMIASRTVAEQQRISGPSTKRSARAVDLICERILAPHSSPMTTTEMERLTGLTGRALAYAFHERFGCSPQTWQRNYFLDEARKELQRDGNTASVKIISRQFGFLSSESFSRFYLRRFGERPAKTMTRRQWCLSPAREQGLPAR